MHSEPKIYETFDHTADLGIKVTAKNITGLFFNSAQTLNDLLVDDVPVVAKSDEQIEINAPDQEMLLHDFLAELLSLFWSDNQLITKIKILELTNTHLKTKVKILDFNPKKVEIKREIKAITYHQFEIGKTGDEYFAKFVCDI